MGLNQYKTNISPYISYLSQTTNANSNRLKLLKTKDPITFINIISSSSSQMGFKKTK